MNTPKVSVLMSVYNSEKYLAQSIESVLNQTFEDFEFIIIDDGSKDLSFDILKSFAAKDNRINISSRENRGIPCTRNEMLNKAQGEFIAVMDSDDIALSDRLALQVAFLQQNPEVVCVSGAFEIIDDCGRFLTCLELPEDDDEIQRLALAGHSSVWHPCAMFRREAALKVGGYEETMPSSHDLDLWLKLGEVGKLANLKTPLLKYRLHMSSISGRLGLAQRNEGREACERAWKRRGIEGKFEAEEPWRPLDTRESQFQFMLQYGWWAFNSGQRETAIIYGTRAISALPFRIEGWKLLVCAAVKPVPSHVTQSSKNLL